MGGIFVREGHLDGAALTLLGFDQLVGEVRDKMILFAIGVYVQRHTFLLRQTARSRGNLRDRFAVNGADETDVNVIAILRLAILRLVFCSAFAQVINGGLHIRIANLHLGALGGDALIFGQFKLRRGLDIGEKRKCLTLFEIHLIDFRIQHGLKTVVLHAFTVGIVEQFFLHLILDLLGKASLDFIQRRFAFAEAGQVGLFLELLGHLTKSRIHILNR